MSIGLINPCLPLFPRCPWCLCFRAQQSSREAQGSERISVRGRGHLEATALEQQPQTHPRLWGQAHTIGLVQTCWTAPATRITSGNVSVFDFCRIALWPFCISVYIIHLWSKLQYMRALWLSCPQRILSNKIDASVIRVFYVCVFSCSTGVRSKSKRQLRWSGQQGIKLQYSSGIWKAAVPITCVCGLTTALEWAHRAT